MHIEDPKDWLERQEALEPFRVGAALPELMKDEVARLGFDAICVRPVGPFPVWSITADVGQSIFDQDFILKVAVKRLAQNLGFKVKMRDIVASVRDGRIQALFCFGSSL